MRTGTVGFPSSDETGALTAGGSGGSSSAMQESMLGAADAASSAPDDVEAGSGSASGGLALSDVTAPEPLYRRTSPRCAPCSLGRCAASIGGVLVPGLVCLTLVPFVFHHPYLPEPWAIADVAVFLVLLSLLLASWLHTVFVDPGSTPIEWHQHISRSSAFVRDRYRLCPKTNMYRPPRSHFDSITRRVVLNMDHFCPWVCNTVGYFNRKFFVLFLFYTVLTTGYAVISTFFWHDLNFDSAEEENSSLFFSLILNSTLCVTVVGFGAFHVKMVLTNETTIEPGRGLCTGASQYNVGWRRNWESVMGENPWLWFLPVYGKGPSGDGVHWPVDEGTALQRLEEMERSRQVMAAARRAADRRDEAAAAAAAPVAAAGGASGGASGKGGGSFDVEAGVGGLVQQQEQQQPYGDLSAGASNK